MPAFRFFDPWAALKSADEPTAPAKTAKAAKAEPAAPESLARLAGLAAAPADPAVSAAPLAPPAPIARAPATWGQDEEERAAIVERDGLIPREWAEGFARLDPEQPPGDVPLRRWQRFVDDVGLFLDDPFCAVAAALGWGPYDLFGCDRDRPFARIDQAGLLWLLNGNRLVMLAENTATIETPTGARETWRVKPSEPGRVLAWELVR
jgi:hypothetical protein